MDSVILLSVFPFSEGLNLFKQVVRIIYIGALHSVLLQSWSNSHHKNTDTQEKATSVKKWQPKIYWNK